MVPAVVLALHLFATQGRTDAQALLDRAAADFEQGRIAESVAGFDELVKVAPQLMPQLWQRGIALYYAGRFADCQRQFEAHRSVNPNDVENAAWHFLCVARGQSPDRARAALLPVGPDARVPMRQVYDMFRGALPPDQVLEAAGAQPSARFFAHLYRGLYFEAIGDDRRARDDFTRAASDEFRTAGGYMHVVARVHVARLKRR
jgi:lipoprotein NlpI